MGRKLRVAAVHAAPVFMSKSGTIAKVIKFIEDAEGWLDFLVFPETFVPGYPVSLIPLPTSYSLTFPFFLLLEIIC